MFSLILAWINGWVNNREAGDFRRRRAHYDVTVTVMESVDPKWKLHNVQDEQDESNAEYFNCISALLCEGLAWLYALYGQPFSL